MTAHLWITYAWSDNIEGDFDYLVYELENAGIPALYDKIALIPGRRLWDQIAEKIDKEHLSGWAYLITPNSLASEACKEELSYALQRALDAKGYVFPLIGLIHNVSIENIPMALRVRLCVNLENPDWIEQIRAGISGQPPKLIPKPQSSLIVKIHNPYLGDSHNVAVEFRPRFGELTYWRIGYPANNARPVRWGSGPANGYGISGISQSCIEGKIVISNEQMNFVGCGNTISPSTSAYIVFKDNLPNILFFGLSKEAFSTTMSLQIFYIQ